MPQLNWQKSSYCAEGNACINIASAPDGTVHLRESDVPDIRLSATPRELRSLIHSLKSGKAVRRSAHGS
ncbi:DUF397 domain-containing protein [Streptomyces flavidovirens]|uniref:DUF397 domain-containing protein n=1 Tax=Streptomyces flavidovirens TaxID=67298 RepID=UPI00339EFAA1